MEFCHGSPDDEDEYLFSAADARLAFCAMKRPVCLFGHTHVPACYSIADEEFDEITIGPTGSDDDGIEIALLEGRRYLINPGAVGQPRDGDARAAYAVYDSDSQTIALSRVAYPVVLAQARILAAGLPDVLARRLGLGR